MENKLSSFILISLYLLSFFVVLLSFFIGNYSELLFLATKENGFFESLSVLFLLAITFFGLKSFLKKTINNRIISILILLFSLFTFLAAMEEISWGQHLFHFQSTNFFEVYNYQKETNLHNLIDANIFSSIIYTSVYIFYVFIPLFILLFSNKFKLFKNLSLYIPSIHVILIILYASTFQIYFYNDIGVFADFASLIVALVLFIFTLSIKRKWDKYILLHLAFIIIAMLCFMYAHKIFSFFNMQYEIRETFVVFASLIYFRQLIKSIENNIKKRGLS